MPTSEMGRAASFDVGVAYWFLTGKLVFDATTPIITMREMAGGSYLRSLQQTFLPELLSMNLLMAGMWPTMHFLMLRVEGGDDSLAWGFWFVMSMALIAGFILAYLINWWLVANGLKHGMITARPVGQLTQYPRVAADEMPSHGQPGSNHGESSTAAGASTAAKAAMTILTTAALVLGATLAG